MSNLDVDDGAGVDLTMMWWMGVAFTGLIVYCAAHFSYAMISHCDTGTASARIPSGFYKGKVVWLTGASSGLGLEMAWQFAKHGSKLIVSARNQSALDKLCTEIKAKHNVDITAVVVDLNQLESLPGKIDAALKVFGKIDVLINNAGVSQRALSKDTLFDADCQMSNINYLSGVCLAKGILPSMHSSGKGLIVNICSVAGKFGVPLRTGYCGSKFAQFGFFDALRMEEWIAETNVNVTNVALGSTRTNIARNAHSGDGSKRGESDANIEAGMTPTFVADRILAGAASNVDEIWLAKGFELLGLYLNQYIPTTCRKLIKLSKGKLKVTSNPERSNLC